MPTGEAQEMLHCPRLLHTLYYDVLSMLLLGVGLCIPMASLVHGNETYKGAPQMDLHPAGMRFMTHNLLVSSSKRISKSSDK